MRQANDQALAKLPKVEGGSGQVYLSGELARILDAAEQAAKKAGDSFVTAEYLLLALATAGETGRILKNAGFNITSIEGIPAPFPLAPAPLVAPEPGRLLGPILLPLPVDAEHAVYAAATTMTPRTRTRQLAIARVNTLAFITNEPFAALTLRPRNGVYRSARGAIEEPRARDAFSSSRHRRCSMLLRSELGNGHRVTLALFVPSRTRR